MFSVSNAAYFCFCFILSLTCLQQSSAHPRLLADMIFSLVLEQWSPCLSLLISGLIPSGVSVKVQILNMFESWNHNIFLRHLFFCGNKRLISRCDFFCSAWASECSCVRAVGLRWSEMFLIRNTLRRHAHIPTHTHTHTIVFIFYALQEEMNISCVNNIQIANNL